MVARDTYERANIYFNGGDGWNNMYSSNLLGQNKYPPSRVRRVPQFTSLFQNKNFVLNMLPSFSDSDIYQCCRMKFQG